MKVLYLTWGETPRFYGVFATQALAQFVETSKVMKNDKFYFLSAVPIIHSGLVREKFLYLKELKKVKGYLFDNGIEFFSIPIYAPQNFINSSKFTFKLMHAVAHQHLKAKIKSIVPDVVHCRSYHAAHAAISLRESQKFNYKVVFDGRGLWPEEIALKKRYKSSDRNYMFLKSIERNLLGKSDVTVTVSDTMYEHYRKLGVKDLENIYLSVALEKIRPKVELEATVHKADNKFTLLYLGALDTNSWHRPVSLLRLYQYFKKTMGNTKLIIATTSDHDKLREVFHDFPRNEVVLTSFKTTEELANILASTNFACLPYRDLGSFAENMVGKTMLGTKTVEYLAACIPVLCNKFCGGAASIIQKGGYGIVYDPVTMNEINYKALKQLIDTPAFAKNSGELEELFDYKSNSIRYKNIYSRLIPEKNK